MTATPRIAAIVSLVSAVLLFAYFRKGTFTFNFLSMSGVTFISVWLCQADDDLLMPSRDPALPAAGHRAPVIPVPG